MLKNTKFLFPLILMTIIPIFLVWIPFFLKLESFWGIPLPTDGMATVVSNYDGPLYIVVAKSLYNTEIIKGLFNFSLPVEYYPAHFPMFPILIKLFAILFGFPYSMLFVTIFSSLLAIYFFFLTTKKYFKSNEALWLTFVFSIFPARWLIVRSVGSAEPLFVAAIIASIYYFDNKKYLLAGIFGALAQLTKSPGALLFVSYFLYISFSQFIKIGSLRTASLIKKVDIKKYLPLFLMPFSLIAVFYFYKIRTGDFLAYFHSGDNIHIFFPPFQVFNYSAPWVGTFWLEEIIFIYIFVFWGFTKLIEKGQKTMAWFVGVFAISLLFISHRDITRYALPILPFLIIGFSDVILNSKFKYLLIVITIPIYLFSIVYISQNTMPITDWAPLL